ncbi:MAG: PAS domain S-box protein [Ignavibacteria bacterium]
MQTGNILIVEDEKQVAVILQRRLAQYGYTIVGLTDTGEDAIVMAKKTNPDLILMDINLRGKLDGVQAVEEILKSGNVPIIYLTALADKEIIDRASHTNPSCYLLKPVDERALYTNVIIALNNFRYEKKMKENEDIYNALVNNSLDCIYSIDFIGRILTANKAMSDLFGYHVDGMIGLNIADIFAGNTTENIKKDIELFSKNELKNSGGVFEIKTRTGNYIHIEARNFLICKDGQPYAIYGIARDITERNVAMNELNQRNEKLRKLSRAVEQSPVSIVITNIDGNIEYVNPKFTEVSGYTSEEAAGNNPRILKSGEMAQSEYQNLWSIISSGGEWKGEFHNRRKNGELYWESASISPIKDNEGRITHYLGVKEDTTNRKMIENALIESEDRYRRLVELSLDTMVIYCEGIIVFVNEAAVNMLKSKNKEDILGKPIMSFVHPEFHGAVQQRKKSILEEQKTSPFVEEKFIDLEGKVMEVEVGALPTTYKGKPAVQVIVRNIEERKKAERQIMLSEERFRTVFENAPIGITISVNDKILQVNPVAVKMFGFDSADELAGTSEKELATLGFIDAMITKMEQQDGSKMIESGIDTYGRRKDGSVFPVHVAIAFLTLTEGTAIMALINDTTEMKNREEQINNSLKEKETLLKEIHHRVKNNLQVISSLLSLQSEYVKDETALALFTDSRNRVKSMALIHERLYQSHDLSKIDFGEYIRELSGFLSRSYIIESNNVQINIICEDVYLTIDSAIPCGLILNELISNALKYAFPSRRNGNISVIFKEHPKDNDYLLTIKDDGIGFPEGLDFTETATLGLQLVNNLVDQLCGTITLSWEEGTVFTIKFPAGKG